MSNTVTASASKKSAYKRPYKTRSQRREKDRRKYDESTDYRFLWRVAIGIGVLIVLVLAFALKGTGDANSLETPAAIVQTGQ